MATAIELEDVLNRDQMAVQIAQYQMEWTNRRSDWLETTKEVREYIFATDTSETTNKTLPWKNSVHIPKLCQIRDNLQANYMAALFPNDNALIWEGDDSASETKKKRVAIQMYMANKMRMAGFRGEVQKLVHDYIDYGNAFAMPQFVAEYWTDPTTGEVIPGFIGPQLKRISPLDITFDPTAASFIESPKIIRSLRTLASIASDVETKPELGYQKEAFEKVKNLRHKMAGADVADFTKNESFAIEGFGSYLDYFKGGYVEILDFYGDLYDNETGQIFRNHLISVIDRCYVVRSQPNNTWTGYPPIRHVGWRQRQDNLYAMGPLDNLIGMQYRIDHLENAKSDAVDLIIHPVIKVKGLVDPFTYGPGEEIHVDEEGDVEFMAPDTTFLTADFQIDRYESKMEEMAGAPKQAMGFRTPGEKTAFEVQALENAANRIFMNKTSYFEELFLEPLLNDMLILARQNMNEKDVVRVIDESTGAVSFKSITKEDLTARGKIRPVGARHFAQNAQMIQNLTQLHQSLAQDPSVMAHLSGKKIAQLAEMLLGMEKYGIYGDNIRLYEQAETQKLVQAVQQVSMEEMGAPNAAAMAPAPQA